MFRIKKTLKEERNKIQSEGTEKKREKAPRLGPVVLQDEIPDVLLSEELCRGLRSTRVSNSAAKDRFLVLQKKGFIECRKPSLKRRRSSYKIKDLLK